MKARSGTRLRNLLWRRLRWVALVAAARFVVRRTTARQVDQAAAELGERLPAPVRSALDALPRDAIRAGGGVVVAGRSARRLASGTARATRLANGGRRRVSELAAARPRVGAVGRTIGHAIGDDIDRESELSRRELRSRYLRATVGDAAADEALLDRRDDPLDQRHGEPVPVSETVRPGRWRAPREVARETVARVQRTYRPPTRPWDR